MLNTIEKFEKIVRELLSDELTNPVSELVASKDLYTTLDLSLSENGIPDDEFEHLLKDLVLKTPRTATNAFFNQLFGGRNEKAVLGDLLAVILNSSMYTYKVAGPQVGVEKILLRETCEIIGWDSNSDGTFASGGSMTNYMAMVMARDAFDQAIKFEGVQRKMIVYTSKESHYSIPKNAAFSGIGRNNVRYVPCDDFGKMDVSELSKMIIEDKQNGFAPMMVNLTAGTTVMGAFDEITEVRKICDAHRMWIHLDGAYCGSVLFSKTYKHLINGVELVDSFSYNAHKMIGTPVTCSIIVARNKKHLHDSFSNEAS
tara:strand:- start:8 stop:949 length:942 start_codon:yes stop_codon:yes gene_type:complete